MNNPQQLKERIYALNPELVKEAGNYVMYEQIRLENILIAIDKSIDKSGLYPMSVCIHSDGDIDIGTEHFMETRAKYDLLKTFDQNIAENEELVTFLLNIIK